MHIFHRKARWKPHRHGSAIGARSLNNIKQMSVLNHNIKYIKLLFIPHCCRFVIIITFKSHPEAESSQVINSWLRLLLLLLLLLFLTQFKQYIINSGSSKCFSNLNPNSRFRENWASLWFNQWKLHQQTLQDTVEQLGESKKGVNVICYILL